MKPVERVREFLNGWIAATRQSKPAPNTYEAGLAEGTIAACLHVLNDFDNPAEAAEGLALIEELREGARR